MAVFERLVRNRNSFIFNKFSERLDPDEPKEPSRIGLQACPGERSSPMFLAPVFRPPHNIRSIALICPTAYPHPAGPLLFL